jgi:hypothetical protein
MVAEALNDWLPRVIQAVKPFLSSEIEKGVKWSNEVDLALEGSDFGIVCLTPENLDSTWIHYEVGALSKTRNAVIWTFLLSLKTSEIKEPLGKFQHTLAEKTDVLRLLRSINKKLVEVGGDSLRDRILEDQFEDSWPKLKIKLEEAVEILQSEFSNENEAAKIDQILEIMKKQQRQRYGMR